MPDPITTLGVGAVAAYLGKDGLEKLLGPTADYLGGGLKDFTQKRMEAVGRIFVSAQGKLGNKTDHPGEVPPKVLKAVINEGSYSNDSLAVEYFGGILASARTEGGRDDRGARLAKMVDSLSTYQLRAHYLIYATVRKLFLDKSIDFDWDGRPQMQIFIPIDSFIDTMAFDESELTQFLQLLEHILFGLESDYLIQNNWRSGSRDSIIDCFPKADSDGIVIQPSVPGVHLFLAAFGLGEKLPNYIFDPKFPTGPEGMPDVFPNAVATHV